MNNRSYGLGNAGPVYPSREESLMVACEQKKMDKAKKLAVLLTKIFAEYADLQKDPAVRELLCDYHLRGAIQEIDPNFEFPEVN